MKSTMKFFLPAAALAASLPALSRGSPAPSSAPRPRIVASAFPQYDWTRRILGSRAEQTDLVLLERSGADLHSFTPGVADLANIASCDLFIYVGGESDAWAARALAQGGSPRRRVISLVSALGGGAAGRRCPHGPESGRGCAADEHVWLSLRSAKTIVRAIAAEIRAVDPANAAEYAANGEAFVAELESLDRLYSAAVEAGRRRAVIFADRFPFRCLADDYGLECHAAFAGCSAESEAGFGSIVRLARKADELDAGVLLVLKGSSTRIAESVRALTRRKDQRILEMDPLQSAAPRETGGGGYIDAMRRNLDTLKEALK